MTTKYELTDADRKRLGVIAQRANGKPKVDDIAWKIVRDWFATLPVVPREAVERAFRGMTEDEGDQFEDDYTCYNGTGHESRCHALNSLLARRRAMLDDVTAEPNLQTFVARAASDAADRMAQATDKQLLSGNGSTPKAEPVLAGDDLREQLARRVREQIREIVRERGVRVRAGKDGDTANRIHWGVASAMTSLYDSLFSRSLDDDLGWDAAEPPKVEPTPKPQPAIDVVAELAEIRKNADRCLATLGVHRSQLDDVKARIDPMSESLELHRGTMYANSRRLEVQSERLDDLRDRVAALESAAQRRPRWRWW